MSSAAAALSPSGALAAVLGDYEDRPGQRQMAEAVAAAFADDRPLLVEAGTGTGKTLAYLIAAVESGRRVVVSTGTRTLQEQLVEKDVPLLQRLVGPVEVAVVKGVSNYVCRRKLGAAALAHGEDDRLARLLTWVGRTDTGDRAEHAELGDGDPLWAEVTTTTEARLGPTCPHHERCFVTRARRAAERAAIIVVNHHLLFADLALRAEGGRVLPDYDAVVLDEAHQLEDVLTEHFGIDVSSARIELLARDALALLARDADRGAALLRGDSAGERIGRHLEQAGGRFLAAVRRTLWPDASGDHHFGQPPGIAREDSKQLNFDERLRDEWLGLDTALDELACHARLRSEARADDGDELAEELATLAARADRLRDGLATIAEREGGRRYAYWAQLRGQQVSLRAAPVAVDDVLARELLPRVGAAVLTSATLTAAGSFDHVRERLGLSPDMADELRVDSPFDYAAQCLVYVARDLPDPREPDAGVQVAARIAELAEITDGRAFALFTSHRALQDAAARLPALTDRPLWVQGRAPRAQLVERFVATPGSLLLATGSFWEGVDVPGAALSQVILDRLPFSVPTDPLALARAERLAESGRDAFADDTLPRAVVAFRQGFGRLIRRQSDRGVVSVLDPRLVTKRYGRAFFASLPEVSRTSSLERVRRWWAS